MHPLREGFTAQRYIGTRSDGKPQVVGENEFGLHYREPDTGTTARYTEIEMTGKYLFQNGQWATLQASNKNLPKKERKACKFEYTELENPSNRHSYCQRNANKGNT